MLENVKDFGEDCQLIINSSKKPLMVNASCDTNALKRFENSIIFTCFWCCRRLRFLNRMPCPLFAISKLISGVFFHQKTNDLFSDVDKLERWIWATCIYFECVGCWGFQIRIKFLKYLPYPSCVIGSFFTRLGWDRYCILFHLFKVIIIQPWNWQCAFLVSKDVSYHMWYE